MINNRGKQNFLKLAENGSRYFPFKIVLHSVISTDYLMGLNNAGPYSLLIQLFFLTYTASCKKRGKKCRRKWGRRKRQFHNSTKIFFTTEKIILCNLKYNIYMNKTTQLQKVRKKSLVI